MPTASLDDVLTRFRSRYSGDEEAMRRVCTRLFLRTGVNLKAPRPDQVRDERAVGKVVAELSAMGFSL